MKKIEKLRDLGKYLDEHCLSFEAECDGLGEWRVRLRSVVEWEAGVTAWRRSRIRSTKQCRARSTSGRKSARKR